MNTFNAKSIVFVLEVLSIMAFGLVTFSTPTFAEGGVNYIYNNYTRPVAIKEDNPKPFIDLLSPDSSNIGIGTKTITVIGGGFVPGSVARVNGSNRSTTFIDNSNLLMQITGNDILAYRTNGGFFVTIWNSAPGGGFSNAVFFTINNSAVTENNPSGDTTTNFTNIVQPENVNVEPDNSNLTSNAIFGSNGIYPSSLMQWILFAILILLIVILVRKVYGADKRYHATPMKHE